MKNVVNIGEPPWNRSQLIESLDEFISLYSSRPIQDNQGGMKSPHMFAVWFMAKQLSPDLVVESGIWKGQSTWLLEQACPNAKLICIDINLKAREYISDRAIYSDRDFSEQDWSEITDHSLVFFDDHQNAYKRLQQCKWFGFKNIIFEDNYPVTQGDCYSLKKAFENAGFEPEKYESETPQNSFKSRILRNIAKLMGLNPITLMHQYNAVNIRPNETDSKMLHRHLEVYYEFPPVVKPDKTRWGDNWEDDFYPTAEPLFKEINNSVPKIFVDEAIYYTWICYAKLKS